MLVVIKVILYEGAVALEMFHLLDKLRPNATGLDHLPAWFLRLAASFIYQPLTRLFNLSISTGTVPWQWKQAIIRPVPKVAAPTKHADFRPHLHYAGLN